MPSLILLADLIPSLVQMQAERREAAATGQPRGPVTGFPSLDREIGGVLAPGLHVAQGAPGAGKTAWALQVASDCGWPGLFITAELVPVSLFERLIARATETPLTQITTGELAEGEILSFAEMTACALPNFGIVDASLEGVSVDVIQAAATLLRERAGVETLLVVIDSLQVWSRAGAMGGIMSDYDSITAGVHGARALAIKLQSPVLLVSHRNRAGQAGGGLFASKGSGDIEYAAETVTELTRDTQAKPDRDGEVPVRLTILKNRHGNAGAEIALRFCGVLQRFREGREAPASSKKR